MATTTTSDYTAFGKIEPAVWKAFCKKDDEEQKNLRDKVDQPNFETTEEVP